MEEYCKNCGAKVKNGAKFCKDCGSPIEYSDKTKGSLQNSSEDKHVCMNCGKELTGDEEFCTECGSPIGLKTVRAEDKIFCENCGTEMSADVDFCPECGFGKRHSVASTPSHSGRDRKVMYALIGVVAVLAVAILLLVGGVFHSEVLLQPRTLKYSQCSHLKDPISLRLHLFRHTDLVDMWEWKMQETIRRKCSALWFQQYGEEHTRQR